MPTPARGLPAVLVPWLAVIVAACGSRSGPAVAPVAPPAEAAIERGLLPTVQIVGEPQWIPLEQRMRELNVHAVSIAVFDDYEIRWARAYGLADVEAGTPADEHTTFLAGSISKAVNALGQLQSGLIPLDAPINDSLVRWKLPENDLTRATPVTLRMLLSHTGGVTVPGFRGYAPDEPLPTILQILDGEEPANSAPIRVDIPPGSQFRYAGGGTTVSQVALTDRSGLSYPEIMQKLVLGPLGMTESSFDQVLDPARLQRAAVGYDAAGNAIPGKRFVYPEMAAAGLWTTPTDLAKVFLEIAKARAGQSTLITKEVADQMTTRVVEARPKLAIGLGVFLAERGGVAYFGHGGSDTGFQAEAIASLDGGRGVVVMTNSDSGLELAPDIFRTVVAAHDWPGAELPISRVALDSASRGRFVGRYDSPFGPYEIIERGEALFGRYPFSDEDELVPTAPDLVVDRSDGGRIQLDPGGLRVTKGEAPPSTIPRLTAEHPLWLLEGGKLDAAVALLQASPAAAEEEAEINAFGYDLMSRDLANAERVLRLNVLAFPDSANAQDSYGEVLGRSGRVPEAIAAYERVLVLVPADPRVPTAEKPDLQRHAEGELATLRERQ